MLRVSESIAVGAVAEMMSDVEAACFFALMLAICVFAVYCDRWLGLDDDDYSRELRRAEKLDDEVEP